MLLPDHFGVYEPSREDLKIKEVGANPDYNKVISMYHAKNYLGITEMIKSGEAKTPWAVWFIRNLMLDSIKFYLNTLEINTLSDMKDGAKFKAKQSYDMLKSSWFKSKLNENDLELDRSIWEAIEETYREAKKLDK
ncbi:MAG: hypothetical protein ABIM99_06050 [Candidatus Dojkabacteria bacterium]